MQGPTKTFASLNSVATEGVRLGSLTPAGHLFEQIMTGCRILSSRSPNLKICRVYLRGNAAHLNPSFRNAKLLQESCRDGWNTLRLELGMRFSCFIGGLVKYPGLVSFGACGFTGGLCLIALTTGISVSMRSVSNQLHSDCIVDRLHWSQSHPKSRSSNVFCGKLCPSSSISRLSSPAAYANCHSIYTVL